MIDRARNIKNYFNCVIFTFKRNPSMGSNLSRKTDLKLMLHLKISIYQKYLPKYIFVHF